MFLLSSMQRGTSGLVLSVVFLTGAIGVVGWLIFQTLQPVADTTYTESEVEDETVYVEEPPANPLPLGRSVEGRLIEAYTVGSGDTDLLFVGGIHGGYEWNSSLLAWEMIDYFTTNPQEVPRSVSLHIIPTLNPDGLATVLGTSSRFTLVDVPTPATRAATGRFNAHGVDLNRNFDCNWAPESTWRGNQVSAGTSPFSEPEAAILRDYVLALEPVAVVFWHSQANTVYGSACNEGVLPLTTELGERYAAAAQYGWVDLFDAYPITGDAEGWLASIGIPAITVELESYQDSEFARNLSGVKSWLTYFSEN